MQTHRHIHIVIASQQLRNGASEQHRNLLRNSSATASEELRNLLRDRTCTFTQQQSMLYILEMLYENYNFGIYNGSSSIEKCMPNRCWMHERHATNAVNDNLQSEAHHWQTWVEIFKTVNSSATT